MPTPTGLTSQDIGALAGGTVAGIAGSACLIFWIVQRSKWFPKAPKAQKDPGHPVDAVRREEFESMRDQLNTALDTAREAKALSEGVQKSFDTIGHMIESSIRSLGDRIEGTLLSLKNTQDRQEGMLGQHQQAIELLGSRTRTIETEVDIAAGRPPRAM